MQLKLRGYSRRGAQKFCWPLINDKRMVKNYWMVTNRCVPLPVVTYPGLNLHQQGNQLQSRSDVDKAGGEVNS